MNPTSTFRSPRLAWFALTVLALIVMVAMTACTPAPEPAAPLSQVSQVSDIDVTANVKTALLRVPSLQGKQIAVVTTQGDVRLTAVLDNQDQIDTALRIARAADGVRGLQHELTLRP